MRVPACLWSKLGCARECVKMGHSWLETWCGEEKHKRARSDALRTSGVCSRGVQSVRSASRVSVSMLLLLLLVLLSRAAMQCTRAGSRVPAASARAMQRSTWRRKLMPGESTSWRSVATSCSCAAPYTSLKTVAVVSSSSASAAACCRSAPLWREREKTTGEASTNRGGVRGSERAHIAEELLDEVHGVEQGRLLAAAGHEAARVAETLVRRPRLAAHERPQQRVRVGSLVCVSRHSRV